MYNSEVEAKSFSVHCALWLLTTDHCALWRARLVRSQRTLVVVTKKPLESVLHFSKRKENWITVMGDLDHRTKQKAVWKI